MIIIITLEKAKLEDILQTTYDGSINFTSAKNKVKSWPADCSVEAFHSKHLSLMENQ